MTETNLGKALQSQSSEVKSSIKAAKVHMIHPTSKPKCTD